MQSVRAPIGQAEAGINAVHLPLSLPRLSCHKRGHAPRIYRGVTVSFRCLAVSILSQFRYNILSATPHHFKYQYSHHARMRIASVALAVVPILSLAHTDLEKVVAMIPTMEELNQTYPDIVFESTDNPTSSRDVVSGEIAERNIGYKFVAGGLSAVGYYAFGGGCDQVDKAYAACTDSQGSNFQCVNRAAGAATAHIMIGGAGFVGGREFVSAKNRTDS